MMLADDAGCRHAYGQAIVQQGKLTERLRLEERASL